MLTLYRARQTGECNNNRKTVWDIKKCTLVRAIKGKYVLCSSNDLNNSIHLHT